MGRDSTIYDIAREAGVSIATVSRVLRGEGAVAPKTRQKVEETIAAHNYRPSAFARGMTTKKTNFLGIILPKILNPNYAMYFSGAADAAREHGYTMSLFPWKSIISSGSSGALLRSERRLDGAIICVEYLPPEVENRFTESLEELRSSMPVVLIGCVPVQFDCPTITYNMAEITRRAVEYLIGLGHERIALIGGVEEDQDGLRRDVGYRQGLEEARLPFVDSYRSYCGGTAEEGSAAMDRMLDGLQRPYWPSAIIALNDMVAMGCMESARRHGLNLPEDLSVIGCDNLFCAPYLSPALTSINTFQPELGRQAVEMLLSGENRRENARWELVERASCARARKE